LANETFSALRHTVDDRTGFIVQVWFGAPFSISISSDLHVWFVARLFLHFFSTLFSTR
jgi:hypothetical protein